MTVASKLPDKVIVPSVKPDTKALLEFEKADTSATSAVLDTATSVKTLEPLKKLRFKEIAYPLLFLPFLSIGSEVIGKKNII